ncbi:MAG: lipase family protein [Paracoccaceae bacterium]
MKRLGRFLRALVLIVIAVLAVFWWVARPSSPGEFYEFTADPPATPGELLRQEVLEAPLPEGAKGYRILYSTTRHDGSAAVASAVVVVPETGGAAAPVVAYAHGTTGVRPGCAPSVFDNPFPNVPGFPGLLAEGWAYVATDYVGLGTEGGHFYLVGDDAARAVLDSIRASGRLEGVALARNAVVWGHSQGGHSALWTGQRAADYAPDLSIAGIAAVAPATDLPKLAEVSGSGTFGKIVLSYITDAYDRAYPDIGAWSYVRPVSRWLTRDIASRCIESPDAIFSVLQTMLLPGEGPFARSPLEGAFGEKLAANVPTGPFAAPTLIAQGGADDLILPDIQDAFVAKLCAAGVPVEYRRYPGKDHISVVAPESPLTADLIAWTRARFDGAAPLDGCGG